MSLNADEMELNSAWRELPTMKPLDATGTDYDVEHALERIAEHERGRQEGLREAREAREIEHCREHMRDGRHGETRSSVSAETACALSADVERFLANGAVQLPTGVAIAGVEELVSYRKSIEG